MQVKVFIARLYAQVKIGVEKDTMVGRETRLLIKESIHGLEIKKKINVNFVGIINV